MKKNPETFPYPHKYETTHSILELVNKYEPLITENDKTLEEVVSVAGRVLFVRSAGKFLLFLVLSAEEQKI